MTGMATYFPGSSNQRDTMPTLCLRDPGPNSFPEQSLNGNMLYMNYLTPSDYSDTLTTHHSQPQQNCVGLHVPTSILSQESRAPEASEATASHHRILSHLVASRLGENNAYNTTWRDGRNGLLLMQSDNENPQIGMPTLGIIQNEQNLPIQGQGLSLSLGTQIPSAIPVHSFQYRQTLSDMSAFLGTNQSGRDGLSKDDPRRKQILGNEVPPSSFTCNGGNPVLKGDVLGTLPRSEAGPAPYALLGLSSTISNSKYLKAAQQLLDEVVNVGNALKPNESGRPKSFSMATASMALKVSENTPSNLSDQQEANADAPNELSPTERQDLQTKLTKLLGMLDEVDRRYKQYYHQMQIVVSSFDAIAGAGAAKTYTALALQTISKHFRCLRDAINGQIRATQKSLGEQDPTSNKSGGGLSRLRFVDQQLRQQRALQQLGMMQQHAWRPQRGLPESSVSILRAWLFEHFLHPYPKDSDKLMLARQTGLSRSQVSNWFINARVRLWKPMVEEMYKEEIGEAEMDSISSSEKAPTKGNGEGRASDEREELVGSTERHQLTQFKDSKSELGSEPEMAGTVAHGDDSGSYGHPSRERRSNNEDCSLLQDALGTHHPDGHGRFMSYDYARLEREAYAAPRLEREAFAAGKNSVSLTLGLQHCDGQQSYMGVRGDEIYNTNSVVSDSSEYDCINRRHRFGSSHLLHDFVA
ncbi:hypothetical protein AMTRI_Chr03g53280 [Amborella trichopoda]|uniref:Homeobox domain-containing protein n=1 Tax=Amborella trichopoda TaxID=13333 RepID=W1P0U2_AMBTC|nr:BEL1-like homeodomain protein 7 [Amborella trichopoda]XP_011621550.1 BEL1-like homeodomain protein 7 [Amborella trichopoda]XP_011621551.1 BEL1-like homeodomain protein 7 [Amborella trichopoda]ERN01244.1 hypothetical protein AMTR_s00002p00243900 [Amborella trichopoda]|eukprot:XP_006838675.1 BEL1-like homeodomain protein 7 [Amborella trichopoda]